MQIPHWAFCSIALLLIVLAQELPESPESIDITDGIESLDHAEDRPDGTSKAIPILTLLVCHALYEAQAIIVELQPAPFAHLEKKVGVLGTSQRGWADGLGWGQDGPVSTALRLIPRFFNSLLSPLSYLSRIPMPSYLRAGEKGPKRVKISRTRRGKIDHLYALLDEAEQAGCEDVHGVRASLRMVSWLIGKLIASRAHGSSRPRGSSKICLGLMPRMRWADRDSSVETQLMCSGTCKSNLIRKHNSWSACSTRQGWEG